jgi:tRNA-specific adenosine deaminase 1
MQLLAALQDPAMAALKDSVVRPVVPPGTASRGRDDYSLFGVLRTKPGRADSPPTLSMSCSDKIAVWNVAGIQGALVGRLLEPVYIDSVIIGGVPEALRPAVKLDCERALWGRLENLPGMPYGRCCQNICLIPATALKQGYALHKPAVYLTDSPFIHSHPSLSPQADTLKSCSECTFTHP